MGDSKKPLDIDTLQPTSTVVSAPVAVSQVDPSLVDANSAEFEPDPKWELTNLDKPAYDCGEILASLSVRPITQQNGKQGEAKQETDSTVKEQQTVIADTSAKVKQADTCGILKSNTEPDSAQPLVSAAETEKLLKSITESGAKPEETTLEGSNCDSSTNPAPSATVYSSLTDVTSKKVIENSNLGTNDLPILTDIRDVDLSAAQPSATTSIQVDPVETCVLSQSSGESQLDKMIENIVNLTGDQQFSHGQLSQPEDRDKAVEKIHQEIISARPNPMEIMADIASRQEFLVADVPETPVVNEERIETAPTNKQDDTDLKPSQKVEQINEPELDHVEQKKQIKVIKSKSSGSPRKKKVDRAKQTESTKLSDQSSSIELSSKKTEDEDVFKVDPREVTVETILPEATVSEVIVEADLTKLTEAAKSSSKQTGARGRPSLKRKREEIDSVKVADTVSPQKKTTARGRPSLKRQVEDDKKREELDSLPLQKKPSKRGRPPKEVEHNSPPLSPTKFSKDSRKTISSANPATGTADRRAVFEHDEFASSRQVYKCDKCKYSTERLNNIVFHYKSNPSVSGYKCLGAHQQEELRKEHIIKLQQTPKASKRRSVR